MTDRYAPEEYNNNRDSDAKKNNFAQEICKDDYEDIVERRITEADIGDNIIEKEVQDQIEAFDGQNFIENIKEEEEDSKLYLKLIFYIFS